jgi:hypothetical protein
MVLLDAQLLTDELTYPILYCAVDTRLAFPPVSEVETLGTSSNMMSNQGAAFLFDTSCHETAIFCSGHFPNVCFDQAIVCPIFFSCYTFCSE